MASSIPKGLADIRKALPTTAAIWDFFYFTGEFQVVLDRRLYQDDNRGLGQGVTDNKITPANFRLVVERFKSPTEPVSIFVKLL